MVFPDFATQARIGNHDIYLNFSPESNAMTSDQPVSTPSSTTLNITNTPFCRGIRQFQEELHSNTTYLDTLLQKLRDYYESVKTKHQLDLEVPEGFRKSNQHYNKHKHFPLYSSKELPASQVDSTSDATLRHLTSTSNSSDGCTESSPLYQPCMSDTVTNPSPVNRSPPIVRSVDKPSSPLPCTITMSEDFLRANMGFRRVDTIKQHLSQLYCDTSKLDSSPADAI